MIKQSASRGVGVVEIMVVVGIVSFAVVGLYEFLVLSTRPISEGVRKVEATYLAQEGLEAVRTLRNKSWDGSIVPLTVEATYYAVIAGSEWALTTTDPGPLDGLYTRTITLHKVFRDPANDNISPTGTEDPRTRRVTAVVSWKERGKSKQVMVETYLTDFLDN